MTDIIEKLRDRARSLKHDTYALYLAARDPRTPAFAKLLAMAVAAYALSPIDLIPDFIPVLGYLDDLLIVPLGITAAVKLVPSDVMQACRAQAAEEFGDGGPGSRTAAVVIVVIWVVVLSLVAYPLVRALLRG